MDSSASALLTLPSFHPAIPASPGVDRSDDGLRLFAAGLAHAGVLQDKHLTVPDLRKVIDRAVNEWLSPYHAQLDVFDMVTCGYTSALSLPGDESGNFSPQKIRKQKPAAFMVSNNDEQRQARYIGATASALQRLHPGAGADLMLLLNVASSHGIGLYDPCAVFHEAESHFWHGESDISFVASQFRDESDDREKDKTDEQILEENDIPTPKEFFAIYPEWAAKLDGTAWGPGALPSFPKLRGKYRKAMDAANDLADHLRMVRLRWMEPNNHEASMFPNDARRTYGIADVIAAPILLRWTEHDWHVRLLDDSFNALMQDCDQDHCLTGMVSFDPADEADCRDSRERFEALLTTGILTDRLLQLTTTPDRDNPA